MTAFCKSSSSLSVTGGKSTANSTCHPPTLAADAKLQVIVGPAPAGPCMGIWRETVLDWPGSVFMVGAPPKPGVRGCWVRPGQGLEELEATFGLPQGGHPGIWFRVRRAAPGLWR